MKLEAAPIQTADGVQIFGGYWEPTVAGAVTPVDAWLLLPGASGSFYSQVQGPFAEALTAAGYPVLTLSTRGHDLAWQNRSNGRLYGLAAEIIAEAGRDIVAGLDELERRGARQIGLLGHSMGAIKCSYFLANEGDPRVRVFAQVSGGRVGRPRWESAPHRDKVEACLVQAQNLLDEGRGDELTLFDSTMAAPSYFTPRSFLDRHLDDRYDTLKLAARFTVPTIFVGGSEEPEMITQELLDQFKAQATGAKPVTATMIAGADHFYTGKAREAIAAVVAFAREIG
ncbi:MAG: alpha/beta hydrolase family protein [Dehalococcoidia bacterium]